MILVFRVVLEFNFRVLFNVFLLMVMVIQNTWTHRYMDTDTHGHTQKHKDT